MKRYRIIGFRIPCETGDWVNYDEVEKIKRQVDLLGQQLIKTRKANDDLSLQITVEFEPEDGDI